MIVRKNQAVSGALLSLATLWIVAIPFGLLAEAHFNGPFSAPNPNASLPSDMRAPLNNMLDFQGRNVFVWCVLCSLLLVAHWTLLLWREAPLHGQRVANLMLILALFTLSLLWLDEILDEYYRFSFFCIAGGEPVFSIDMGWQCISAYYAHDMVLPYTVLGLIVISFLLRLLPARRSPSDGDRKGS